MASMRGHRVQVGSSSWIGEERSSALQIVQSEVEEFSYSARNELEWLNEHMAGIFDENEVNFAEAFKTPGKLRGKTPKSTRKAPLGDRAPLSDIFASTPNGSAQLNRIRSPKPQDRALKSGPGFNLKPASQQPTKASQSTQDSGYYGSQDVGTTTPYAGQDYLESQTPLGEPENKSPAKSVYSSSPVKAQQSAAPKQEAEEHEFSSSPQGSDPGSESPQRPQNAELNQNAALESMKSPSDGSSPIRPMVRKSSINFASLPAREPLATGKSMGGRTSYLDANRTGYFRTPGGKSLGNLAHDDSDEEDEDKMAVDDVPAKESTKAEEASTSHAKTYTQRLQDQINKLGKSQTASIAQSKSVPNTQAAKASSIPKSNTAQGTISTTPKRKESIQQTMQTTPGAFPEDDDDDDWIEPSSAVPEKESRPMFPKSYSADVMEGIHNKQTVGQPEFALEKSRTGSSLEQESPTKEIASSTPAMITKSISMTGGPMVNSGLQAPESPSRLFRDSPLRQVKNKLSSILKSSKGLLASSAAISAEGKSLMSPSLTRLGLYGTASSESVAESSRAPASPTRSIPRPVTASSEFDKEEKRRAKEEKLMSEQLSRLDKAREQEREKARVFSKEQERIAAMESQVASKKQAEAKKALPLPKAVRSSPRKGKSDDEDEHATEDKDTEMEDAPATAAQSLVPKPTATGHALRNREVKRPVKPGKDPLPKAKQVPTVIRVNTSSQNSQYHSSSRQSTNPQQDNTLSSSQQLHQLTNKASKPSLQTKASTQSLKPAPSGKSKAAEAAAAKKKEQEEREAQRRRNAKAEADRKRVALAEEQRRQEQQRRVEAEKKQKERDQAEEKKSAQRQAAIERAKQTKAPPPAARSQPNGPPDFAINQGKGIRAEQQQPPRPQSRMGTAAGPSSTVKAGTKRVVPGEAGDDGRPVSRAGYAYQSKDAKRRRTSEILSEEPEPASQHIKGPPVRPSAAFKKDGPSKTLFQNGYSTAPQGAARDLFKATVAPQHGGHAKGAHPLDMAQISNGKIPFAGNPNPPSSAYKTPARPGPFLAKSAAKSVSRPSPQFQNGESIELPEIQTDDEDEEDDAQGMPFAQWVESPFLRDQLARQDGMDPSQIFGPPVPINMEEVFQKSKERWHTFRARTSSANWSGTDRLTEDDIRRDMVAREKLRRDGGWSYEMSKGL